VAMSRIVSRIALRTAFLLFPCVIAVCSGAGRPGSRDRGHHPVPQSDLSRDCNEPETLPNFGLPIQGIDVSVISFNVSAAACPGMPSPRLAVLYFDTDSARLVLAILKPEAGKLTGEFSISDDSGTWQELDSFPTKGYLPGVVIWASEEYAWFGATVVAYVKGKFQVVFRGEGVNFLHLDEGSVPEIVTPDAPGSKVDRWRLWVWSTDKYVSVADVPWDRLYSAEVRRSVRRVKKEVLPEGSVIETPPCK